MSGFASWLGGQGGYLNPRLKPFIEVDDNGDRGVVAEEDIEEGQQLMLIPMSCCLHMPTQQECSLSQVSGRIAFCRGPQVMACQHACNANLMNAGRV